MNFSHSNDDSNVMSMEWNSYITVDHKGRSICTPTVTGLSLRQNFELWHSNISGTNQNYCRNSSQLWITVFWWQYSNDDSKVMSMEGNSNITVGE